jgi:hypothetical protein
MALVLGGWTGGSGAAPAGGCVAAGGLSVTLLMAIKVAYFVGKSSPGQCFLPEVFVLN